MERRIATLALTFASMLGGCATDAILVLDLRTDLVPGREFDAIELVVDDGEPESIEPDAMADYVSGARLAERGPLAIGERRVQVRLLRGDDEVLARPVLVELDGDRVVTVVLTRDCRGVSCPVEGGDATATACVQGECVDATCTPETPEACEELTAECTADADCGAAAACASPRCLDGICYEADANACGDDRFCDLDVGCRDTGSARPRWSVAAGPDGFYLLTSFSQTVQLGGQPYVSEGGTDSVILAFGPDGTSERWTRQLAGAESSWVDRVAVDTSGRLVIAGGLDDGSLFSDDGLTFDPAPDGDDYFIAALNPDGTAAWARSFVGPNSSSVGGWTVFKHSGAPLAPTTDGGVYAVVLLREGGVVTAGGEMLTAPSGIGAAVLALDANGVTRWSYVIDGDVEISGLASSGSNVYVSGTHDGMTDLGDGPVGSVARDGFLLSIEDQMTTAAFRWQQLLSHPTDLYVGGVAADASGNVALTGTFTANEGDVDIAGTSVSGGASWTIYVAGFLEDGTLTWTADVGGSLGNFGFDLGYDPAGDRFYVTGHLHGEVTRGAATFGVSGDTTGFWWSLGSDGMGLAGGPMPSTGDVAREWITWSHAVSPDGATLCAVGEGPARFGGHFHRGDGPTVFYDCVPTTGD